MKKLGRGPRENEIYTRIFLINFAPPSIFSMHELVAFFVFYRPISLVLEVSILKLQVVITFQITDPGL